LSGAGGGLGTVAGRRFKPYPAYKDSGVEWLGEIPAHWTVSRMSELTSLVNGYPFDAGYFILGEGWPLVRIRDLNATQTEVNYIGPVVENVWIEPGDVIVGMDGEFNVARWRGVRGLLNQRMCCLRARAETNAGFIAHLLPFPLAVINDLTYSTTVKHLSSVDVRKIRLGAPPQPEQRAIAAFLDQKTARIDALVAKKERLIELLREKRTALITRAVTKGLDAHVPMKDSGVEWVGEIPAHWEARPLKYFLRAPLAYGVLKPDKFTGEDGVRLIRILDVESGQVSESALEVISPEQSAEYRRTVVRAGDLVLSVVGTIGRTFIVPHSLEGANLSRALARVQLRPTLEHRFLEYGFSATVFQSFTDLVPAGTAQRVLNLSDLAEYPVAAPPHTEQRAIAAFLNRETAKIDWLMEGVRQAIDRLREYRTALISAAVTGKIDVREEMA